MSRLTDLQTRLANLQAYKAGELKAKRPSKTYIDDLNESIKYVEKEIARGAKEYEMVNGG